MTNGLPLLLLGLTLVGVAIPIAHVIARRDIYGDWKKRFRHPDCGGVSDFAFDVCKRCGEQMSPTHVFSGGGKWETVICRDRGFGWEFKHNEATK